MCAHSHKHTRATQRARFTHADERSLRERFTSFPCIVRKGKSSWETQAASNSDGTESSASDDEDGEEARKSSKRGGGGGGGASRRSEEPTKKKQRNKRKLRAIVYTDAQLSGLLKDVIDKGEYTAALSRHFHPARLSTCIRVFLINESALVALPE